MTSARKDDRRSRSGVSSASPPPSPARAAAFEALTGVDERRGEPAALLHRPRYRALSQADRDLSTEIVLGVLRHRASLDWVLSHHSTRPLESLDPALLRALRIGLYQIRHLDRVPHRAAVDESVRLARAYGAFRGAGLVNAVLRNILRQPGVPSFPDKEHDPLGYLTTTLSHPRWLAERYLARLGVDDAEARCRVQNLPPKTHLRVSSRIGLDEARQRLADEGIDTEPMPAVPGCLSVVRGVVAASTLLRDGLVFAQDAGSQLVPRLLALRPGDRVLDVCAAPGGKATAMSESVGKGSVVALDLRVRRARLLVELARRLRADNVAVVVADGRNPPFSPATAFGRVLLDAPCTSLGTIRRNPDLKWRVTESDLGARAELQYELLRSASSAVARDGRLLYVTCSTEPEENEQVVHRFLASSPEFALAEPSDVAECLPTAARYLVSERGFVRTLPERDEMDGYFAAAMVRRRVEASSGGAKAMESR